MIAKLCTTLLSSIHFGTKHAFHLASCFPWAPHFTRIPSTHVCLSTPSCPHLDHAFSLFSVSVSERESLDRVNVLSHLWLPVLALQWKVERSTMAAVMALTGLCWGINLCRHYKAPYPTSAERWPTISSSASFSEQSSTRLPFSHQRRPAMSWPQPFKPPLPNVTPLEWVCEFV